MKEGNTESFKNFGDLQKSLAGRQTKKLFDEFLKGRFDTVPQGQFESKLPQIESISITSAGEGAEKQIQPVIFFKSKDGKQFHSTWVISQNGSISGDVPKGINISKDALSREILEIVEKINTGFWFQTDLDVIPAGDEGAPQEKGFGEGGGGEHPVDPERLPFWEKQNGAIFGFVNKNKGFNGYFGVVFPTFLVLENEKKDNACFILDLEQTVQIPDDARAKNGLLKPSAQEKLISDLWEPVAKKAKTRRELVAMGAERIIHTKDSWKEKIRAAIDKRFSPAKEDNI